MKSKLKGPQKRLGEQKNRNTVQFTIDNCIGALLILNNSKCTLLLTLVQLTETKYDGDKI